MKRGCIIAGAVAVVALLLWWLWPRGAEPVHPQAAPDAVTLERVTPLLIDARDTNTADEVEDLEVPGSPLMTRMLRERRDALERVLNDWRTPIEFYGKVVDENGDPVAKAHVRFSCNDLSPEGTSFYETTSDADGLFSISEIQGLMCDVDVSKPGYYKSRSARQVFYYAGLPENFVPNRLEPVVFRLHRHGQIEPLVRFHKSFPVQKDGTPVLIDLASGATGGAGGAVLQIECWTQPPPARGAKFDWQCRVHVPGGGLQPNEEEFGFTAPLNGYVEADWIDMRVTGTNRWQSDVTRSYFVRTADGRYGRVVFRMVAGGDHFCRVESLLNPSGSRNLEYRPPPPAAPSFP